MINEFFVFGERCSGTNFLSQSIIDNFGLQQSTKLGHKHFFGHRRYTDNPNCIHFGIVRDIISWVDSLYKTPHHIAYPSRKNKKTFLTEEFFSVWDNENRALNRRQGEDIIEDYHITKKRRFKSIFELRNTKNLYMINTMPTIFTNFYFLRYEDLRDNYDETLNKIATKFNLSKKEKYKKVSSFKGYGQQKFKIKKIENFTKQDIIPLANLELERTLGYKY